MANQRLLLRVIPLDLAMGARDNRSE